MYILDVHEGDMSRSWSVAEARTQFPKLLHAVEGGEPVRITRRGRAVAVLVSETEFQRLVGGSGGLVTDYERWRAAWAEEDRDIPSSHFEALRDSGPGRDVII